MRYFTNTTYLQNIANAIRSKQSEMDLITGIKSLTITRQPDIITYSDAIGYSISNMIVMASYNNKNEWINRSSSTTINGVTWTVNSDGSIKANGKATANSWLTNGSYIAITDHSPRILTGCPSGGGSSTFEIHCRFEPTAADSSNSWYLNDYNTDGSSGYHQNTTIPSNYNYVRFEIGVRSGVTVNNVVFWPMLRLASISNGTFEKHKADENVTSKCKFSVQPNSRMDPTVKTTVVVNYKYRFSSKSTSFTVGENLTPSNLTVVSPPSKTSYLSGQTFSSEGLKVSANFTSTYLGNITLDVTNNCTLSIAEGTSITQNTTLTISYKGKSTTVPITFISSNGILLTFSDSAVTESTSYDYVIIYYNDNGTMRATANIGGTFDGKQVFIPAFQFYISWKSDSSSTRTGWSVKSVEAAYQDSAPDFTRTLSLPSYTNTNLVGTSVMPSALNYGNNESKLWTWDLTSLQ